MEHELKIKEKYLDRILSGEKTFEVRKNDRDYQSGDVLNFIYILDEKGKDIDFSLVKNDKYWEVTYVHKGLGLKKDYVVLGIKRRFEKHNRSEL